jgi:hypothetical protein
MHRSSLVLRYQQILTWERGVTKRNKMIVAAAATLLAMTGCAKSDSVENNADLLENAAEQSTPEGAEALRNAADEIRDANVSSAPADPNGPVQKAMERAGNAQMANPS